MLRSDEDIRRAFPEGLEDAHPLVLAFKLVPFRLTLSVLKRGDLIQVTMEEVCLLAKKILEILRQLLA